MTVAPVPPNGKRGVLELTANACRWPTEQVDGRWQFCFDPCQAIGKPYCPHHTRLAYGNSEHVRPRRPSASVRHRG